MMIAKADIVTCTIKDCRNKPSKGPKSIAISVSSIVSNAEASNGSISGYDTGACVYNVLCHIKHSHRDIECVCD